MTTSGSWHATRDLLERYAAGHLDPAAAWSIEQHVTACQDCRSLVAPEQGAGVVATERLDAIWAEVAATVDVPAPGAVERLLLWIGVPDHVARLLAATPALTLPWLVAVALVLGGTAAVSLLDHTGPLPFLTIAPLVPLAGVALAFGRWTDPTHEVALAAPVRSGQLLLVRAAAVTGTSLVLAALAALLLPGYGWMAAAWVLPAVAMTATLLAVSTWWSPTTSAIVVGGGWIAAVLLVETSASASFASFSASGQALTAILGAVATAVVLSRRETLDGERTA